jgi:hypothetical protein
MPSGGMIYTPSLMKIDLGIQVTLTSTISEVVVLVLQMRRISYAFLQIVSGGKIYLPSLVTIGSGIRVILIVKLQQFQKL